MQSICFVDWSGRRWLRRDTAIAEDPTAWLRGWKAKDATSWGCEILSPHQSPFVSPRLWQSPRQRKHGKKRVWADVALVPVVKASAWSGNKLCSDFNADFLLWNWFR